MRALSLIPCAAIALSLAGGTAHAVIVPLAGASSAAAFNMDVNLDGEKTALGNQVAAGGHAPPSYNSQNSMPSFSRNYSSPSGVSAALSGGSITSIARSAGPVSGQITSVGQSSIGTFNSTVNTPLGTLISITAGNVISRATYTLSRNNARKAVGYADIGKVTINGPLLGINNKTFSGSPKVNQVLYQSPDKSVTIYLNRQVETMAAGKPTSITVDAIAVVFNKAINQASIGADIVVGTAMAN
jgi:hypothetical protein